MKKPTTLQQDAEKFADFIVNNYPDAKEWHDPVAKAAWYISLAFVAVVLGDDGEIVALCAARPVDRPGIGVLPYYYNEHGRDMHVALWCDVSGDDRARQVLKLFFQMQGEVQKLLSQCIVPAPPDRRSGSEPPHSQEGPT